MVSAGTYSVWALNEVIKRLDNYGHDISPEELEQIKDGVIKISSKIGLETIDNGWSPKERKEAIQKILTKMS